MLTRLGFLGVFALTAGSGCDFFKELESVSDSTDTDSTGTGHGNGGTSSEACVPIEDDWCLDQDQLQVCQPDGTLTRWDCGSICGDYVNVTCLPVGGANACWCVEFGKQKVLSCTELETCLSRCTWDTTDECANRCFSRTTASVVRMYGAVVQCAYQACREVCLEDSAGCQPCVDRAMAGLGAGCALERSVCDEDKNDEEDYRVH